MIKRAGRELLMDIFDRTDAALAPEIASGVLHKGTVLAVFLALRDAVAMDDPGCAELLTPVRCEKAVTRGLT